MSFLWYWPAGGWNFARWKSAHPWTPISTEQSGREDLLQLTTDTSTKDHWHEQRDHWLKIARQLLGEVNDVSPKKIVWEWLCDPLVRQSDSPFVMRRLRYTLTEAGEWGYAWLCTPSRAHKSRAAVIALHQTVMQGKNEPVGLEGRPGDPGGMEYARHLAERGVTVLAPDAIAFGERSADHSNALYRSADQFFAAHPDGSVMAKMIFDVSRAIDLLSEMPGVDPEQIGCIGHSHGGYGTLFAMLFDQRLKAGVISCGFNSLRDDPSPQRWWEMTALIPRLGYYANRIHQTPIDFHILLSLIAPRPLIINAGRQDKIFPNPKLLDATLNAVRGVYKKYDADQHLHTTVFDGPHDFPETSRELAYSVLTNELTSGA